MVVSWVTLLLFSNIPHHAKNSPNAGNQTKQITIAIVHCITTIQCREYDSIYIIVSYPCSIKLSKLPYALNSQSLLGRRLKGVVFF